jgi:isopenicillin-N epimerase
MRGARGIMNRRHAIRRLASAAALLGAVPATGREKPLPEARLRETRPEEYWLRVREEQFFLPANRAFLNNGSLGVIPRPVMNAVTGYLERAAALEVEDYPRWGYETLDEMRAEMAAFLGCDKDGLAFTHNCTEALSVIANGLDLAAGDEVLTTDQEHASGYNPWLLRQARDRIELRKVALPVPPEDPAELTDRIVSAIGPRTRVLMISAITTTTGLVLPVREICRAARAKGVLTVVDGAHLNGQVAASLEGLECDLYAGSPHKWMFAPAGCGILWGRPEALDRLWPAIVTGGWDSGDLKAARFMRVGTNNRAIFEGMIGGVRFFNALGAENVYARIHDLARRCRRMAAERDYLELLTPDDDRLYGSLVTFRFRGRSAKELAPLWAACRERRIWTAIGERLRISAHVHTRPQDLELFFATADEILGRRQAVL